jgi:hypothetical protein
VMKNKEENIVKAKNWAKALQSKDGTDWVSLQLHSSRRKDGKDAKEITELNYVVACIEKKIIIIHLFYY